MGLLNNDDRAQMTSDLAELRADRPVSVVIRRKNSSLLAQTVCIVRLNSQAGSQGDTLAQQTGRSLILGSATLDIQNDDRLTVNGQLYQVTFVRPDRELRTAAEAEVIQ